MPGTYRDLVPPGTDREKREMEQVESHKKRKE
jgi:hypothetical protein